MECVSCKFNGKKKKATHLMKSFIHNTDPRPLCDVCVEEIRKAVAGIDSWIIKIEDKEE